tara:strand:+ start:130 stop:288 length:159 start_codon:yes stop_codon:yes gene_type:complete
MLNLQYVFKLDLSRNRGSTSPRALAFKVMKKALSSVAMLKFPEPRIDLLKSG